MAQFDWKHATFKVKDGYVGPGGTHQVNLPIADPSSAPTATATGGGSSGGFLASGTYLLSYTFLGAVGETLRSADSTPLVVASGNIPAVTLPSLPANVTGINLYISTPGGNNASEKKYNTTPIVVTVFNLDVAAPGVIAPPVVNNAGGYLAGTTTMVVDGFTGAVVNTDLFTVAGDTVQHKITGHSETGGNTTSITFTPALGSAVADEAIISVGPHELVIKLGEGNCQWTEKRNIKYTLDRGLLDEVRLGDETPMEVKIDTIWDFLTASTGKTPTISDVLKKRGEASNWVSSDADPCRPYSVDIEILYTPLCETEVPELIILPDFRYEQIDDNAKDGMLNISGKCNVQEAIVSRVT